MRSVFHTISSLQVRGSCVVCCTVSVCTTCVRNNDRKVDPLSEVGVCVLAVRGCASARGRLSTVLVGGRLSRNHAQFGVLMPTSFRMICSVSEFLILCVVRSVGWCCCLVPGLGVVGHAFCVHLSGTVSVRWMRVRHSVFCVRLGKVGSLISASYHDFGCRRHVPDM